MKNNKQTKLYIK